MMRRRARSLQQWRRQQRPTWARRRPRRGRANAGLSARGNGTPVRVRSLARSPAPKCAAAATRWSSWELCREVCVWASSDCVGTTFMSNPSSVAGQNAGRLLPGVGRGDTRASGRARRPGRRANRGCCIGSPGACAKSAAAISAGRRGGVCRSQSYPLGRSAGAGRPATRGCRVRLAFGMECASPAALRLAFDRRHRSSSVTLACCVANP